MLGDIVHTKQVKGSENPALIARDFGSYCLVLRFPTLTEQQFVAKSCIAEIVNNPVLHLTIEEMLTHPSKHVRLAAKFRVGAGLV